MNKIKSLISQLIEEYRYMLMVKQCRYRAKQNNKPIYPVSSLFAGNIVKLEKQENSCRITKVPVQDFALFISTPYYINFATGLELEPCYNDQIGQFVIDKLTPLQIAYPEIMEKYNLTEKSKLSKIQIIDLEKEISETYHQNQPMIGEVR